MATISDVENGLVGLISGVLYPNAGAPPSILGYPVKIYAGWPDPETLDADLVEQLTNGTPNGKPTAAHVSVYPLPAERNMTRYLGQKARVGTPNPHTYTLTVAGSTITVGGAAPQTFYAQNLAVLLNGAAYLVAATAGQTAAQVAAALQAVIVAAIPGTTVNGAVITVPAGVRIGAARVGTEALVSQEVRRTERQFQISVWSSNPISRAAVADVFDPVLAGTPFLTLADGTDARLIYRSGREDDVLQKQRIYRRSMIYTVEFATILNTTAYEIVAMELQRELIDRAGNILAGPFTTFA